MCVCVSEVLKVTDNLRLSMTQIVVALLLTSMAYWYLHLTLAIDDFKMVTLNTLKVTVTSASMNASLCACVS
jgi:hypothetical protein